MAMISNSTPLTLQIHLQNYGALRPEAWQMIWQLKQQTELQIHQNFIRKEGTIAYVADGLLKEYDTQHRSIPSIINFISAQQCLVTRKHNKMHYLKTCLPTLIYYWDFEQLQVLYQEYKELKKIYDSICAGYDERILFRMHLLELPVQERIDKFRLVFKPMLPYLKKKDMANYLHLSYSFFVNQTNKRS